MIPLKFSPSTRKANKNFEEELNHMWLQMKNKSGLLIILDFVEWRWYLPKKKELEEALPLQILYQGLDGTIYIAELPLE
jgi:hypothetical protein